MARKEYLFTYGTLRSGMTPPEIEPVMRRCVLTGRGFVNGVLYNLGTYPGAILSETEGPVWGEVFELPDDSALLRRLDGYEQYDPEHAQSSEFIRMQCTATLETGLQLQSWIYVYNRNPGFAARIADGDFTKFWTNGFAD